MKKCNFQFPGKENSLGEHEKARGELKQGELVVPTYPGLGQWLRFILFDSGLPNSCLLYFYHKNVKQRLPWPQK